VGRFIGTFCIGYVCGIYEIQFLSGYINLSGKIKETTQFGISAAINFSRTYLLLF